MDPLNVLEGFFIVWLSVVLLVIADCLLDRVRGRSNHRVRRCYYDLGKRGKRWQSGAGIAGKGL